LSESSVNHYPLSIRLFTTENSRLTSPAARRRPLIIQLHRKVKRRIAALDSTRSLALPPTRVKVDTEHEAKRCPALAARLKYGVNLSQTPALGRRCCSELHLLPKEALQSDTSPQSGIGESLVSRRSHDFHLTKAVPAVRCTSNARSIGAARIRLAYRACIYSGLDQMRHIHQSERTRW
jgi:hypothetical protein